MPSYSQEKSEASKLARERTEAANAKGSSKNIYLFPFQPPAIVEEEEKAYRCAALASHSYALTYVCTYVSYKSKVVAIASI